MPEIEIKLQIPPERLQAVRRDVLRGRSASARFRSVYFDTPGGQLAAAGVVLRLRREGGRWIQAVKGRADGLLVRLEHEVARGRASALPALDVALHDGTDEGRVLRDALGSEAQALVPVLTIETQRTVRHVRHEGTLVELALDTGHLVAGARREPIRELELELTSGRVPAMLRLAARWSSRHGLWLDVRTKAERGLALARGAEAAPAVHGARPVLSRDDTPDQVLRACVAAALAHLLPQGAQIAAGRAAAEHVHQARVALRRLLSVLREFGDWSPQVDAQWSPRLHALFAELGQTRDRDVLGGWIFDELQAAGAPAVDPGATMDAPDLASRWRSHEVTGLMLELLAFAYGEASAALQAATPSPGPTLDRGRPALRRLHRRVQRAGRQFAEIDDVARHRARKQLKRLRYGAENLSSLFPAADWARYLARLKRAQDALGRFQDLTLVEVAYRSRVAEDPRAWFALGWIAARRSACIDEAGRALIALDRAPKFLR